MSVIRTVTPKETSKMVGCFSAAFVSDSSTCFVYPEASAYFSFFPRTVELHIGDSLCSGTAFTVDEFRGVAAFIGPEDSVDEDTMAEHILSSAAAERAEQFLAVAESARVYHPERPH